MLSMWRWMDWDPYHLRQRHKTSSFNIGIIDANSILSTVMHNEPRRFAMNRVSYQSKVNYKEILLYNHNFSFQMKKFYL